MEMTCVDLKAHQEKARKRHNAGSTAQICPLNALFKFFSQIGYRLWHQVGEKVVFLSHLLMLKDEAEDGCDRDLHWHSK